jgi:uncharacterized protein YwgA
MKPIQREVIILELAEKLREKESWCGETHLQKAVYFLQVLLSVPLEFEFVFYKHGPFSFELQDELTSLRAYDLLRLEPQPNGYGPKLSVSESGQALKKRYPKTISEHRKAIEWVADYLSKKGVVDLERLGTALYVSREENMAGKSEDEIVERIVELKPHITKDQAREALQKVSNQDGWS